MAYFGQVQAAVLYVYLISPRNTWLPQCHYGSNWRNIEKIELSLGELLPVYLVDNCICNTGCLVGFRGLQNITYYIWNGEMQNLADWPAEF